MMTFSNTILSRTASLLLVAALWTSSCDLAQINVNPNDPLDVPMSVLLPPALSAVVNTPAQDAAVYAGIFAQYFTGVDNQALPVERYLLDESFNMNPIWQDFYNVPLHTLQQIIDKAEAEASPHYAGIARVMFAMNMGTVTSLWGDVPFSEAFGGSEAPSPAFDDQASIYGSLQNLLDQAIEDLNQPGSVFSPSNDDVIYQGDLNKWRKLAYAVKARLYLHTVGQISEAADLALAAISNSWQSAEEGLSFPFGFSEADLNPWFLYFRNTPYITIDEEFVQLLSTLKDPRQPQMIRRSFGINRLGDYYAGEFASLDVFTFSELKFLEAEALLRRGQNGAEEALKEAIETHVSRVAGSGISPDSIASYAENQSRLSGDFGGDLERIMTQKYIAMFTTIEGWTDYRRTGYPALSPNTDGSNPQNPGGDIPRRFIYPQNERLFNTQFPEINPNLQDRFWWDQ